MALFKCIERKFDSFKGKSFKVMAISHQLTTTVITPVKAY